MANIIYTVYKVTNKINNKIYIGVHGTKNPNDGYMGSGKLIMKAIKKYGDLNFNKEILFEYDDKEDAYLKEAELVNKNFILETNNYNLVIGGRGGYVPSGVDHQMYGKQHSEESKERMSNAKKEYYKTHTHSFYGKTQSDKMKSKIAKGMRLYYQDNPLSNETKKKMSIAKKEWHKTHKNVMFKGYYITPNGKFNSAKKAADSHTNITLYTINKWCKKCDIVFTKHNISHSKLLRDGDLGKSPRDLGFYFIYIT